MKIVTSSSDDVRLIPSDYTQTSLSLSPSWSLRAPCTPAHLPPVAVWLIIVLRLAGCLAGGLQVNLILKSGAGCDVWGTELVWSSASHLTLVNSSNETAPPTVGSLFFSFVRRVRGHRTGLLVW